MPQLPLLYCFILLASCTANYPGKVYVTNYSSEPFDSTHILVSVNNQVVFDAPAVNQYISHHWHDTVVNFNKGTNHIHVAIYGGHHHLQVDSLLTIKTPANLFIQFEYHQYLHKYSNPEIYQHLEGEVTDLVTIADSLYNNKIISGVGYLDDSIPTRQDISIFTRQAIDSKLDTNLQKAKQQ